MATVFLSYSHVDEALKDRLSKQLKILERQGLIETWHDRRIRPGQNFAGEIDKYVNGADIIILLVSSDFLASDYCYDVELAHAMKRHNEGTAVVLPVILRDCDWHDTAFGKLLALPTDGKPIAKWEDPDEALAMVARAVRSAANELKKKSNLVTPLPTTDRKVFNRIPKSAVAVSMLAATAFLGSGVWQEPSEFVPVGGIAHQSSEPFVLLNESDFESASGERANFPEFPYASINKDEWQISGGRSWLKLSSREQDGRSAAHFFEFTINEELRTPYQAASLLELGPKAQYALLSTLEDTTVLDPTRLRIGDSIAGLVIECKNTATVPAATYRNVVTGISLELTQAKLEDFQVRHELALSYCENSSASIAQ